MTRVFDAPRKLVFDALTRPELVKRWLRTGRLVDAGLRDRSAGWAAPFASCLAREPTELKWE